MAGDFNAESKEWLSDRSDRLWCTSEEMVAQLSLVLGWLNFLFDSEMEGQWLMCDFLHKEFSPPNQNSTGRRVRKRT